MRYSMAMTVSARRLKILFERAILRLGFSLPAQPNARPIAPTHAAPPAVSPALRQSSPQAADRNLASRSVPANWQPAPPAHRFALEWPPARAVACNLVFSCSPPQPRPPQAPPPLASEPQLRLVQACRLCFRQPRADAANRPGAANPDNHRRIRAHDLHLRIPGCWSPRCRGKPGHG